jgi:ATP-binding cassette subfamily B (MDR/TAP) protein 6
MNLLNIAQSVIIVGGIAAGLAVCTQGIAKGSLTVGDAVLFVTLMQQLYAPLNFFGTYYRMIQQSMVRCASYVGWERTSLGRWC